MTAWAWVALTAATTLITAALGDLISEELRGWLDLGPSAILKLAAIQLDPTQRETIYQDEWRPELCYILRGAESRPITRLIRGTTYATGLLISARRIARINERAPRTSTGTATMPTGTAMGHSDWLSHKDVIARVPSVTGLDLHEWFRRLDSGPTCLRLEEQAHWLADEHGLTHGYATAIVHEHELRRRVPNSA